MLIQKLEDLHLLRLDSCFQQEKERARDLISTSSEPLVDPENDKPTIIALREIAEGFLDEDYVPPSETEEGDTEEEFLDNVDEE